MKLVFVYNANAGKVNAAFDIAHKLLSPSTYRCSLCSLTHGIFGEKEAWRKFRESSSLELEFLHKDEFEKLGYEPTSYPVILKLGKPMEVIADSKELSAHSNVESLITLLQGLE